MPVSYHTKFDLALLFLQLLVRLFSSYSDGSTNVQLATYEVKVYAHAFQIKISKSHRLLPGKGTGIYQMQLVIIIACE